MFGLEVLLPMAFLFVLLIGGMLWWAIFSGQFDDVKKHGESILHDDDDTTALGTRNAVSTEQRSDGKSVD